jgi:hypothetical protein
VQAAQQVHHCFAILRVQVPDRLVSEKCGGLAAQSAGYRHALLLAARKRRPLYLGRIVRRLGEFSLTRNVGRL